MNLKKDLVSLLEITDNIFVRGHLKIFGERGSLLLFLFHNVFNDQNEIDSEVADPQQGLTLEHYRQFIEYFLECGYQFVSPPEVLKGLDPSKKYLLMTFDDGYFGNSYILPLLHEYNIPAVFYIATNYVKEGKSFWWDSLYRERLRRGSSREKINAEKRMFGNKKSEEIESYLIQEFGRKTLTPIGDIDRPFTPKELKEFSKDVYVHIGNHTADHALLPIYSESEIRSQVLEAQTMIEKVTGTLPTTFAYPYGGYSKLTTCILKEFGFQLGITCNYKKNYLPIDFSGETHLKLNRFFFLKNQDIKTQGQRVRSDASPFVVVKNLHADLTGKRRRGVM